MSDDERMDVLSITKDNLTIVRSDMKERRIDTGLKILKATRGGRRGM